MTIDLLLLCAVLAFGFFGMEAGAIAQLANGLGLLLAYAASRPVATLATPYAAPDLGLSPHVVNVVLSGLFFFVFFSLGSWLVRRALQKAFPESRNGRGDRAFGFLLGAGKGALILYAAASFYVFFEKPLTKAFGAPPPAVRNSEALKLARKHDLLNAVRVPALAKVEKLIAAGKTPGGAGALPPELQQLLADPKLKSALQDGSLANILNSGDLSALQNDPRLAGLLANSKAAAGGASGDPAEDPR
jgi:uncharacterized membrane protein required for colicin V production